MQHKVYMTPKLYEKLYHKKAQTTGIYCIEKNISKKKNAGKWKTDSCKR